MNPIRDYLKSIEQHLLHGDATEHTHRAALESLLKSLSKDSVVTNEPKHIAVGAPDFVIRRKISETQYLPIGYIETKDIDTELDLIEKSEQLKRYLTLDNLVLTDYLEFRWYIGGKRRTSARLAHIVKGKPKPLKDAEEQVSELLMGFLTHEPLPISSPQELAKKMAALCRQIDRIIVEAFKANTASELLSGLKEAFERTLLPDLSPEQFADMFAQTLAYGLFAARINHFRERPAEEFRRSEAAREIPKTNPFLRKLFDTITGADIEDEPFIGFVDDLAAVMQHADIGAILQHFGRRTGQEDPVVHFYETFLAAYDPKMRKVRGVYYTPEPVVSYIVRSVDILLKEKFGLKDGLADRSTLDVPVEENGVRKNKTLPKVLILDPACGTGTFLYAVIDLIRKRFMESGNAGEWSDFVREHLLPRIYGFELLMAPYTVAHLKLAMQLSGQDLDEPLRSQWAYDFKSDERLNIYLTNSLEYTQEWVRAQFGLLEKFIADEAAAAHGIKGQLPIMVVLGNPPYSGHSANRSERIEFIEPGSLYRKPPSFRAMARASAKSKPGSTSRKDLRERKAGKKGVRIKHKTFIGELLQNYYLADGKPLGERNPKWLQDDYVKFIRFGQWRIEQTRYGILAYISNHAYLDNPTFRGMRQNLMRSFDEMYLLDLHGNAKKKEKAPDGGKDENVFDIQQGVAIGIFVKQADETSAAVGARRAVPAEVSKSDAFGLRERKYQWLFGHDLHSTEWVSIEPDSPFYLFVKQEIGLRSEYQKGWAINSIMPVNSIGIVTARDKLTIQWSSEEMASIVRDFVSLPIEEAREKYDLGKDARDWKVLLAQEDLRKHPSTKDYVKGILYRPFDKRFTYYTGQTRGFICMPRREVMRHMLAGGNMAIVCKRQSLEPEVRNYFSCSNMMVADGYFAADNKGRDSTFPLYLYPDDSAKHVDEDRRPNLAPMFIEEFSPKLSLKFVGDGRGDLKKTFGPEDVFDYVYAIFHSLTYRSRYAEFLKIDFPRVPLTSNVELFRKLVALGGKLVKLHLLEDETLDTSAIKYPMRGEHIVEKVRYVDTQRQVWINKTQYFEGVPPKVWNFHIGGYQVAEKWLKDRKGRVLSSDDREHYRNIIAALRETIMLMREIDKAIPKWPIE